MMSNSLISIAPMLKITNRYCRYFLRLLTKKTLLYTEMVSTGAVLFGDSKRALAFNELEHPVALQLGGSDPAQLQKCAKIALGYGYDEVNLNVGCPSKRVQAGSFGACLFLQPELVAKCIDAIASKFDLPVSIKMRLGVDNQSSYDDVAKFVDLASQAGCRKFIIHARKAILLGLTPRQNRSVPTIDYPSVWRLKRDFPHLEIVINGEIKTCEQIREHLEYVDGVMIGREAFRNPYLLATFDQEFYEKNGPAKSREQIQEEYMVYAQQQLAGNLSLRQLLHPLQGLYQNTACAKKWRCEINQPSGLPVPQFD